MIEQWLFKEHTGKSGLWFNTKYKPVGLIFGMHGQKVIAK